MEDVKIRTCLFGLGHMGRNHLRVLQDDPRFDLVAVIDPVTAALPQTARAVPIHKEIPPDLAFELAVVAAPTEMHFKLVTALLYRGHHVFVEKPAAATESEAASLVHLAASRNLRLAVGNIERCNPVIATLRSVVHSEILGKLVHLNCLRAGGFPRNVKPGNNVILDLGVHDLDVCRMLLGPLSITNGVGHCVQLPNIYDAAEIYLKADTGATGTVHVNWLSPNRMRSIRLTGSRGLCLVDYIQQTCVIYGQGIKDKSPVFAQLDWTTDAQGLDSASVPVTPKESLVEQLDQLHRYLSGEPCVLAIGEELIESVALVEKAERQVARAATDTPAGLESPL